MAAAQGSAMRLPLAKSMTAARSFLLHDQRNTAWLRLPDCRVEGQAPASAARASSVGNRCRQSPISASRLAARIVPERGRLEKMCWSGWAANSRPISVSRALICSLSAPVMAANARVICPRASPSGPVSPGAAPGLTGPEGDARGPINLAFAAMTGALNEQISALDTEIGRLFAAHPDQHIFSSLPRSGTIRAASLLAEIGDCRQRFPTDDALAALAGACPSTRQSGKRSQAVFRWSCNKKLRAAVMDFANGSRMADPWAAAIYAAATGRGARHPHAIRILARAWLRIIWRCWQDGTAFDPALHRSRHLT